MSKLILIGQAPGRNGDSNAPLMGENATKLCELFGCSLDQYIAHTERMNILSEWPGKQGKGDYFPMKEAVKAAKLLYARLHNQTVLFLGIHTAAAFGVRTKFFQWNACVFSNEQSIYRCEAAVIPHPSGVSHWWNDAVHKETAHRFMQTVWMGYCNE